MKLKLTNWLRTVVPPAMMIVGLTLMPVELTRAADKPPTKPGAPPPAAFPPSAPPPPAALSPGVPTPPAWPVQPPMPPAIDPATGLPVPPLPPWRDPEWPEPARVLPEVVYDGLPLGEVAHQLRKEFQDAFDVLIPSGWHDPLHPSRSIDPQSLAIKMQLKNVHASEVFNAMNLMFEAENTPYRWELKLNGQRPIAMLRVLPERMQNIPVPPSPPITRTVYFVGDITEDEAGGGPTIEDLFKTVSEVYQMSYGTAKGVIQFHKKSQLLVVTGTGEQIRFVQQTLSALREGEGPRRERKFTPKATQPKDKKLPTDDAKPQ